ncbi:MAG: hypothetical protein RIT81_38315 [Deltaproteobacteria bacterium]
MTTRRTAPRLLGLLLALTFVLGLADAIAARIAESVRPQPVQAKELPREWRWKKTAHDFEFLYRVKGAREGRRR